MNSIGRYRYYPVLCCRYPPDGLDANMTISTPFTSKSNHPKKNSVFAPFSVNFDKMGLTDNQNPFGLMPFLNPILGADLFSFCHMSRTGREDPSVKQPGLSQSVVSSTQIL